MGHAEVEVFLTSLAVDGQVSASTQNQALSALLFRYRKENARTFVMKLRNSTAPDQT
jgi:DNA-binding TFAR19-related protein (PDSD5 family)